jgi:probable DNA metabolism protein
MTIFICEDHLDGIFTAIYDAWESKKGHGNIKIYVDKIRNLELFCEYIEVKTDTEKAAKVARTVWNKIGSRNYQSLIEAGYSQDAEKADAIYHTIVIGLALKNGWEVLNHLSNPYVRKVSELSRKVWNEVHRYMGFVRFKELAGGVLFAMISPEIHVLPLLGSHFSDRFRNEDWVIYDSNRKIFLLHKKQKQWVLVDGEELNLTFVDEISPDEEKLQELWKGFCENISIKERESYKRQRQVLPLRFRNHMVEFL